jgi:hypothetical protein
MSDYPDWQTFPTAMAGNLLTSASQTLTPGHHVTGVLPVTSFASLSIVIVPTAGACQVTVNHWADAAGTISTETDTFRARVGGALVVRLPLRSAYVSIDLFVTSAGNLVASTWATLLNSASDRVSFPVPGQQAGAENTVVNAGATDQWRMPAINAGAAVLAFLPGNTLAKLTVEVFTEDELGNVMYHLMWPVAPAAGITQALQLPGEIVVVQIVNTDGAAAHSYGVSLVCPAQ